MHYFYISSGLPGISPPRQMMQDLLDSRPGNYTREDSGRGIDFTSFLTMMSERLFEFDPEPELIEAFESFDEDDSGVVKVEDMRKWLSEMADRMDQREVVAFPSLVSTQLTCF